MLSKELFNQIENASKRVYSICKKTSLEHSVSLSKMLNVDLYLKNEYQQYTGSFKLRGATNKIMGICENTGNYPQVHSIVTASTGNHGSAVSYACNKMNLLSNNTKKLNCIVYIPKNIDQSKLAIITSNNAEVREVSSTNSLEGELQAIDFVRMNEKTSVYISPYNDQDVISGQGTIGKEILDEMKPDAVFVSVGGGGLISGIAVYIKTLYPACEVIGCQPENSRVMYESLKAGKVLDDVAELETLSDGTAGGIEANAITFPLIQQNVNEVITATEKEIASAMKDLLEKEKVIVEGSAALTLACLIKTQDRFKGKKVVLVLCGKNIAIGKIKDVLNGKYD